MAALHTVSGINHIFVTRHLQRIDTEYNISKTDKLWNETDRLNEQFYKSIFVR